MKQQLFRIQNNKGKGPYIGARIPFNFAHGKGNGHPIPGDDVGIKRMVLPEEACAFSSIDQLMNWFNGAELRKMQLLGYVITPIKGVVTAIGEKQVLFQA